MDTCSNKIAHPYLHLPGASQDKRLPEILNPGNIQIDGRTLADILDFIQKFARQINYYDKDLNVSDWLAFFQNSIPFLIASISKIDVTTEESLYLKISDLITKDPKSYHLQLQIDHLYTEVIYPWQEWQVKLNQQDNSLGRHVNDSINNQLSRGLKSFIGLCNGASTTYYTSKADFSDFLNKDVWRLDLSDLYATDTSFEDVPGGTEEKIQSLKEKLDSISRIYFEALRELVRRANITQVMEESLYPKDPNDQEKHAAHLGLIFTFLKLFNQVRGDLNLLSAEHLEFFYHEVLKINFKKAVPDEAHIVFETQKHIDQKLLEKGLKLKDGKDLNKSDIIFSLNDEILVDKASIKNLHTLFINTKNWYTGGVEPDIAVEGLYMAPNANSKDGLGEKFKDGDSKNWPTLGAKESKLLLEENGQAVSHPAANIGFILASPVLLLNEGKRTIIVSLDLEINDIDCIERPVISDVENINNALQDEYYWFNEEGLGKVMQLNLGEKAATYLNELLAIKTPNKIGVDLDETIFDAETGATLDVFTAEDKIKIKEVFVIKRPLRISLSGEKEWVIPEDVTVTFSQPTPNYNLNIEINLGDDEPAITFFDPKALEEDYQTELPLVKIELDDDLKMIAESNAFDPPCCLERDLIKKDIEVSFYHYFRHFIVTNSTIDVNVCGVKNLIVQNDENLQDVKNQIYPFGVRPDILDFSVINPLTQYIINQKLIDDATAMGVSASSINLLINLLATTFTDIYIIAYSEQDLDDFYNNHGISDSDRTLMTNLFTMSDLTPNLVGPSFYIGSNEVFFKAWQQVWININWKDKPTDFNEYYKAYLVKDDVYGLNEDEFEINIALRQDNKWYQEKVNSLNIDHDLSTVPLIEPNPITGHNNRFLLKSSFENYECEGYHKDPDNKPVYELTFQLNKEHFSSDDKFQDITNDFDSYTPNTSGGFIRLTLENQDFLHHDYPHVLARQMMAFGKFPDEKVSDAVYEDTLGTPHVFNLDYMLSILRNKIKNLSKSIVEGGLINLFDDLKNAVEGLLKDTSNQNLTNLLNTINDLLSHIALIAPAPGNVLPAGNAAELKNMYDEIHAIFVEFIDVCETTLADVRSEITEGLKAHVDAVIDAINKEQFLIELSIPDAYKVLIPNEPWTPIIKELALDYKAKAEKEDIDLIHLHPFDKTYETRDIESTPPLLPVFVNEGNLFIGLEQVTPGNNLNLYFQLSEATANSEMDKALVKWHYLKNNQWEDLREEFDVLSDETKGLTRSGIVKIAVPDNITTDHTIMPKDLYWFKASALKNVKALAETLEVYTQAVKATFLIDESNDLLRLKEPLKKGSISKLKIANADIKKIVQPYPSFSGKVPEKSGNYYRRVSEHLRHKGRAITSFDYERLIFERFEQVSKAKCINHTHGLPSTKYLQDFIVAPGFVLISVIPDLTKLSTGNMIAPAVPVSLLEEIRDYLQAKNTPFVRLKIMNPRYEKVNIRTNVKLKKGKSEAYYQSKLENDLVVHLAPWIAGDTDQLVFGRKITKSDVIRFIETRDYIDYICSIKLEHQDMPETSDLGADFEIISPLTARSILTAGKMEVLILDKPCEEYDPNSIACVDGMPANNDNLI